MEMIEYDDGTRHKMKFFQEEIMIITMRGSWR